MKRNTKIMYPLVEELYKDVGFWMNHIYWKLKCLFCSMKIPPEEYCHAIGQLMCGTKFRCHIWCYNMPVAMLFFTLFLGLCLAIIPIIETKYMFSGTGQSKVSPCNRRKNYMICFLKLFNVVLITVMIQDHAMVSCSLSLFYFYRSYTEK